MFEPSAGQSKKLARRRLNLNGKAATRCFTDGDIGANGREWEVVAAAVMDLADGRSMFAGRQKAGGMAPPALKSPADGQAADGDAAGAMQRRLSPTGPQLSPREKEVLGLLADGLGVAGISKQLFISESTTKTHISKVYEKLGAGNRAQALMTAMRLGLIANPAEHPH